MLEKKKKEKERKGLRRRRNHFAQPLPLLPKVKGLKFVKDHWPISLRNVCYKIVSKILDNSAFVTNQEIMEEISESRCPNQYLGG